MELLETGAVIGSLSHEEDTIIANYTKLLSILTKKKYTVVRVQAEDSNTRIGWYEEAQEPYVRKPHYNWSYKKERERDEQSTPKS